MTNEHIFQEFLRTIFKRAKCLCEKIAITLSNEETNIILTALILDFGSLCKHFFKTVSGVTRRENL